jgi:hypothetical protein
LVGFGACAPSRGVLGFFEAFFGMSMSRKDRLDSVGFLKLATFCKNKIKSEEGQDGATFGTTS